MHLMFVQAVTFTNILRLPSQFSLVFRSTIKCSVIKKICLVFIRSQKELRHGMLYREKKIVCVDVDIIFQI